MQRLEQEVKELHSGVAALVQALGFLQNFLESDYGLKFQFHAYCNSPLYSHNANTLEVLKQKFGSTEYGRNSQVYQETQTTSANNGEQIVHVRFQTPESVQGLESVNVISGCAVGSCTTTTQSLEQTYVTVTAPANLENHHHQTSSESITAELSDNQRAPIIVHDDEIHIFGISELTSMNMKGESHELYSNGNEIDAFGKRDFEENSESNDEDVADVQSPEVNTVALNQLDENSSTSSTPKPKRRNKKDKGDVFKCPHCRRRCPDRAKLELHMSHHKQQFQCSECGIWLADRSVLNRHMRTHTGDRPFICEWCKETFTRQDIVKKHILRKHKGMIENGNLMSGIKFNRPTTSNSKS